MNLLVCSTDTPVWKKNTADIWLVSIGDAFAEHIEEHIVLGVVELTLDVCGDVNSVYFQDEIDVNLLYAWIFQLCNENSELTISWDGSKVDYFNPGVVVVCVLFSQFALK